MGAWGYGDMGVWGYGDMGAWGYGDMGAWGYGDMGAWGYGDMGAWGYGDMGAWGYGDMGVWGYGDMGVWGYGDMGVWGLPILPSPPSLPTFFLTLPALPSLPVLLSCPPALPPSPCLPSPLSPLCSDISNNSFTGPFPSAMLSAPQYKRLYACTRAMPTPAACMLSHFCTLISASHTPHCTCSFQAVPHPNAVLARTGQLHGAPLQPHSSLLHSPITCASPISFSNLGP
ncbi:unnamed protein product [Closterium sp. Naga37s-1]|nr:unnamed protein product [Closterium sp. Naga37s-1]